MSIACEKVLVVLLQLAQNAAKGEQGGVVVEDEGYMVVSADEVIS